VSPGFVPAFSFIMPNVETQNGEILVPEIPEIGTAASIDYSQMTPAQIEQEVGSRIQSNASRNAKSVDIAVIDSMLALLDVEARVKRQSGNANHTGIGLDAILQDYFNYIEGRSSLETAAQAMAAEVRRVMQSQPLTELERVELTELVTELVGDAELARA
jgi:hypothetical protein